MKYGCHISGFYRGGYGGTLDEEIYLNGEWVPLKTIYSNPKDYDNYKKKLPDSTPSYYNENNYRNK